jgi:hypothetical protein
MESNDDKEPLKRFKWATVLLGQNSQKQLGRSHFFFLLAKASKFLFII